MNRGRPLRFLAVSIGGWITLRVIALWPPPAAVEPEPPAMAAEPVGRIVADAPRPILPRARPLDPRVHAIMIAASRGVIPGSVTPRLATPPLRTASVGTATIPMLPLPYAIPPLARHPARWAASAWVIARGGDRAPLLGGQLGGSQAGARVAYLLDADRRIALAARIAAPLSGRGREAALGVDWQPTRLPLHLIAEQRIGIDGNRGGPTIVAVGGFGPSDIAPRIHVEGYGQAGAIARGGIAGFADGSTRVAYGVADLGRVRFDAGLGAWGGAQRGAARLDIGPSMGVVAPIGGRAVRLTLDWRQRIAGNAAPGSGPALSIGSDF